MNCIYKVFAFISFLVRNLAIPNPFDSLQSQYIEINGLEFPVIPEIINILVEPILGVFTFIIVGLYYDRSEKTPLKGSVLYFIFYWIHVGFISVIVKFNFSALSIFLVAVFYVILHILISVITSKLRKCLYGFSYQ